MEKTLTVLEAYKAMFKFIENYYYGKGKPRELALLLSDIELWGDHYPIDPAMWPNWLDAIEQSRKEG